MNNYQNYQLIFLDSDYISFDNLLNKLYDDEEEIIKFNNYKMCYFDYEHSVAVDFVYYYLLNNNKEKNDYKNIKDYHHILYNVKLLKDILLNNIIHKIENIHKEIMGAILINCLIPVLFKNKIISYYPYHYNLFINEIESIDYYIIQNRYKNIDPIPFVWDYADVLEKKLFKYGINFLYDIFLHDFNNSFYKGPCTYTLLLKLGLLVIKCKNKNYYIMSDSKYFKKYLSNIINNQIDRICIETEYYKENNEWLSAYKSINNKELWMYDKVIKLWAKDNIYNMISDIDSYKYYGVHY